MISVDALLNPGDVASVMTALSIDALGASNTGAMIESTEYVKGQLVRGIPLGVGNPHTRDSLFTALGGTPLELTGLVASPDIQARVLEFGRTPGAKPPPSSAIEDWVGDKIGDATLAFVVARSIGRKGTEARYIFRSVAERAGTQVRAIFAKHLAGGL